MDPSHFPFELDICHDFPFSDSFDRIVSECLDISAFVILLLRGEVVTIVADMYCGSRVGNPHIRITDRPTRPDNWVLRDGFDSVGGTRVSLSFKPLGVLTLLPTSLCPAFCLEMTGLATIVAF